ncbi:hypothetical protein ES703_122829 [subsurface metagenome]
MKDFSQFSTVNNVPCKTYCRNSTVVECTYIFHPGLINGIEHLLCLPCISCKWFFTNHRFPCLCSFYAWLCMNIIRSIIIKYRDALILNNIMPISCISFIPVSFRSFADSRFISSCNFYKFWYSRGRPENIGHLLITI